MKTNILSRLKVYVILYSKLWTMMLLECVYTLASMLDAFYVCHRLDKLDFTAMVIWYAQIVHAVSAHHHLVTYHIYVAL